MLSSKDVKEVLNQLEQHYPLLGELLDFEQEDATVARSKINFTATYSNQLKDLMVSVDKGHYDFYALVDLCLINKVQGEMSQSKNKFKLKFQFFDPYDFILIRQVIVNNIKGKQGSKDMTSQMVQQYVINHYDDVIQLLISEHKAPELNDITIKLEEDKNQESN